jgi:hypothetical protein
MKHNPFYGVIEERIDDRDYMIGGEVPLPTPENRFQGIEYNQVPTSPVSCTIFGSMGIISDITGNVFDKKEFDFLWKKALELGANPNVGWYGNLALNLCVKYWNGKLSPHFNSTNKIKSYRVNMFEEFEKTIETMKKGYSLASGYRGNRDYNNDAWGDGDCILETTNLVKTTYGHWIRMFMQETDNRVYVCDSYKGRPCNVYSISDLKSLVKNRVFFRNAYYAITANSKIENKVSDWAKEAVEWCTKEGIATKWDNPQDIVADYRVELMYYRAGLLKEYTGRGVSKERMAVILYRNHSLIGEALANFIRKK